MEIHYTSEPVKEYSKSVSLALSKEHLLLAITPYRRVANDAYKLAKRLDDETFKLIRKGIQMERKGQWCGDKLGEELAEKVATILMPEVMFKCSMVALQFKAPWGCAFIRLKELGKIKESSGVAKCVGF